MFIITTRKSGVVIHIQSRMSVCLSVCLSVCPVWALTLESVDLESLASVCRYIFRTSRSPSHIKVIGQGQAHRSEKLRTFAGGLPSTERQLCSHLLCIISVCVCVCVVHREWCLITTWSDTCTPVRRWATRRRFAPTRLAHWPLIAWLSYAASSVVS